MFDGLMDALKEIMLHGESPSYVPRDEIGHKSCV